MADTINTRFLDQQVLYGSRFQRFIRELLTHSGIFWLFDAVRKVAANGLITHFTYIPQWVLLGASLIQAWVISRDEKVFQWWYPFIAPTLYTLIDIWVEGPIEFFEEPYHIFYWVWAVAMALAYIVGKRYKLAAVFLKSLLLVVLLPASYLFAEFDGGLQLNTGAAYAQYWFGDSAHAFILFGSLLLGLTLAITAIMRERFEKLLYNLAVHFEQVASWSFDKQLIQQAYTNEVVLDLQRVERAVLFMDIRGFTPWSEAHSAKDVVDMINQFYRTAEPVIKAHHGFKIQMTGDEIMTRFYSPQDAISAARELQAVIPKTLAPLGLSAGIGIHIGEVIEGLVGGEDTRQYGIFGDTVNTAARLQGQAKANEIVISQDVWEHVKDNLKNVPCEQRELQLKGKSESTIAMVLKSHWVSVV